MTVCNLTDASGYSSGESLLSTRQTLGGAEAPTPSEARPESSRGWAEWSTSRLYAAFGLFNGYHVRSALRWALRDHRVS
jgi:hypothetical protein